MIDGAASYVEGKSFLYCYCCSFCCFLLFWERGILWLYTLFLINCFLLCILLKVPCLRKNIVSLNQCLSFCFYLSELSCSNIGYSINCVTFVVLYGILGLVQYLLLCKRQK